MPGDDEIYTMLVNEMLVRARQRMREECTAVRLAEDRLKVISTSLLHHPGVEPEIKALLNQYEETMNETTSEEHRFLYVQGAKDLVALLRKLEVIQ